MMLNNGDILQIYWNYIKLFKLYFYIKKFVYFNFLNDMYTKKILLPLCRLIQY